MVRCHVLLWVQMLFKGKRGWFQSVFWNVGLNGGLSVLKQIQTPLYIGNISHRIFATNVHQNLHQRLFHPSWTLHPPTKYSSRQSVLWGWGLGWRDGCHFRLIKKKIGIKFRVGKKNHLSCFETELEFQNYHHLVLLKNSSTKNLLAVCQETLDQQSANRQPTVGQQETNDKWHTFGRQAKGCWWGRWLYASVNSTCMHV